MRTIEFVVKAFIVGAILSLIVYLGFYIFVERKLDAEYGPRHCGEVKVVTPSGAVAFEHQCWRAK